jgi:hypothetical protein
MQSMASDFDKTLVRFIDRYLPCHLVQYVRLP